MGNGQQRGKQSAASFIAWSALKSDDDFREYVHRGQLKRSDIAAECGFGESALRQNPAIKSALKTLEARLRDAGVLPSLDAAATTDSQELPVRDRDAQQRHRDGQRLNSLEHENASLRAELTQAKALLERYKLLSSFLEETGRMPR